MEAEKAGQIARPSLIFPETFREALYFFPVLLYNAIIEPAQDRKENRGAF